MDKIKIAFDIVRKMKIVAIVLLAVLLTSSFVGATATINVYLDDYPAQATYTIKNDGLGNFWCVRYDGYKASESTDARTLFTTAVGYMNALDKGVLHIKSGDYSFTEQVDISGLNNVIIEGEGYGTHLYVASGRPTAHGDEDHHRIFWAGTPYVSNLTIRNIRFDGNKAGNPSLGGIDSALALIYLNSARDCTVEYCWIEHSLMNGIDLMAWGRASYGNVVQYCHVNDCDWNGISIGSGGDVGDYDHYDSKVLYNIVSECGDFGICTSGDETLNNEVYRILIQGNIVKAMNNIMGSTTRGWRAIGLEQQTSEHIIDHNILRECRKGIIEASTSHGNNTYSYNQIWLKDSPNSGGDYVEGLQINKQGRIIGNYIISPPTNGSFGINYASEADYCIVSENVVVDVCSGSFTAIRIAGGDYCTITDNDVSKVDGTKFNFVGTCTGNVIHGNLGYVTENAGAQTTCINGTAITHGLAGTPTSVVLTMYGQNYINSTCWYLPPTLLSMTSATFTVCFTIFNAGTIKAVAAPNSRTIYWEVLYTP